MSCDIPRRSKSKQVAAAVGAEIERRFTSPVIKKLSPTFDLKALAKREISVWPNARRCEAMTRTTQKADYDIAICVLERLKPTDTEDLLADELLWLVESIGDELLGEVVQTPHGALTVIGYEHEPLYDREMLESLRIFGAAITLQLTREETFNKRN